MSMPPFGLFVSSSNNAGQGVSISEMRRSSFSEWDSYWSNCCYSTYFHGREWAEIWQMESRGKICPAPLLVTFSDGKSALLPLSCKNDSSFRGVVEGRQKSYVSSPQGTYGGWLSADDLSGNHILLLNDLMRKKFSNLTWKINPFDNNLSHFIHEISWDDETRVINLKKGFDANFREFRKSNRRNVRAAARRGVSIRVADCLDDWQDYYAVYEDTVDRWGGTKAIVTSKYNWTLFRQLFYRNSPNIRLWLACHENKIIAGKLCFSSKRHVVIWHSAALKSHLNLGPVQVLVAEIMKDASTKGYSWLDFNPSAGLKGVEIYKQGLGGEALKCPFVFSNPQRLPAIILRKANSLKHGIFNLKSRVD